MRLLKQNQTMNFSRIYKALEFGKKDIELKKVVADLVEDLIKIKMVARNQSDPSVLEFLKGA